ncbi:RxLR effector protein [Phytophthora megakarya]|uniref:RxLR effector protein n=1 Tax=Phytophthora megakarya TaxID=4795 RepID=A0A225UZS8_9STRA|nr:RxLR effector protein [Phytophthora megakarya]
MGYSKIALLNIIILLAVGTISSATNANKNIHAEQPVARLLRSEKLDSYEERISGLTNLKSIFDQTQLAYWLAIRKPASKVFETMKLNKGDNLFTNPKFLLWLTYVDDFNDMNPRGAKSAVSVLAARFGDDRLSKMIRVGMKDPMTTFVARTLQNQRFKDWESQNMSPYFVLKKLDLKRRDIFSDPMLTSWIKYMDEFNFRNPAPKTTMTDGYSLYIGDKSLAIEIESGLKVTTTKKMALAFQTELFSTWERFRYTPSDVFRAVGLRTQKAEPLSDPVLNFWVRYMNEFNRKHPSEKTSLIDTLRKNYNDEILVQMLIRAKADRNTKLIAEDLELLLLTKWLLEEKSPRMMARWPVVGDFLSRYTDKYKARWPDRAS